jgi:hypothetical protein
MSKKFFFHSINFQNYRGIESLSIKNLRRVNIIGGLNGVGKTTVLDGILLMLGRTNHWVMARPFAANNFHLPYPNGYDYLFRDYDSSKPVKIFGTASTGMFHLQVTSSKLYEVQSTTNVKLEPERTDFSSADSRGITLTLATSGQNSGDTILYGQNSPENLIMNVKVGGVASTPAGSFITSLGASPLEDAQRYSVLMKERRTEPLYKYLRLLFPDLLKIQLLHEGGAPILYVEFSDNTMVQSPLLGGGFKLMLSTALVMMTVKNGVFLFDEIDNTIHHSLLGDFWALVAELAADTNGQVFAVTHSRECIGAAVTGFKKANRLGDLGYYRLEEHLNETAAIAYDGPELEEALLSDWEMR